MSKREKAQKLLNEQFDKQEEFNKQYFNDNKELIKKKFNTKVKVDPDKQRKSPSGFALMSEDDIKHFKKYTADNIQEKFSPIEFQKHLDKQGKNINVDEMMQQELTRSLKPLNKKYLKTLTGGKRKKRLHHTVTYKTDKCSPKKSGDVLKFTCYTKDALFKLKDIWNARHSDNKILSNDLIPSLFNFL